MLKMKKIFLIFALFIAIMQISFPLGGEEVEIRQAAVGRLVRYAKIDTQSKEESELVPSTEKQFDLAKILLQELKDLGATDVRLDKEHCYVYATIPSNLPPDRAGRVPVIGFIAHMDVSFV